MYSMYERILDLCNENDIKIAELCRDAGVSQSSLSELKSGRSKTLGAAAVIKIAKMLHVTTDYILGVTDEKKPSVIDARLRGKIVAIGRDGKLNVIETTQERIEAARKLLEETADMEYGL